MPLDEALGDGNSALRDSLLQQYQQDAPTFSGDAAVLTERLSRKLAPIGQQQRFQPTDFSEPPEPEAPESAAGPDLSSYGTPVTAAPEPSTDDLSSFGTPVSATAPAKPEPALGVSGNLGAAGKGVLRGGVEHAGGILQGAAALTKTKPISDEGVGLIDELKNAGTMSASERAKLMGRALRTLGDRGKQMEFNGALQRIARGGDAAAESAKLRESFGAQNVEAAKPVSESPLYRTGASMKKSIGEAVPMTDQEKDSIGGRVGTMAGAILPYAAATAIGGPALGIAAGFTGMSADTFGSVYDAATKAGKTDAEARTSATKAALVSGVLGSLPLGAGKYAKGLIAKMATSSVAFATAGEAQEAILQQIAKDYDPKAGYSLDQKRLIAELILGAGMGGLHHAFDNRQQQAPPPPGAAPGPTAGAIPPGGPQPGPAGAQPGAAPGGGAAGAGPHPGANGQAGPQPGVPNPNSGGPGAGGAQQPPPGAGPQGTGQGKGAGFTMDARMRAKMERVYGMYEPGVDTSKMSDGDLFNAVNEHLRNTSSTGYTAKPETAEEAAAREGKAREREEIDILKKAGWTDVLVNAMTPEQRAKYIKMAQERGKSGQNPQDRTQAPRNETDAGVSGVVRDEESVQSEPSSEQRLRGTGNRSGAGAGDELSGVSGRGGTEAASQGNTGSQEKQQGIRGGESALGGPDNAEPQQTQQSASDLERQADAGSRSRAPTGNQAANAFGAAAHNEREAGIIDAASKQGVGRRENPIVASTVDDVLAASEVVKEPTPAQAKAGNYQHGHLEIPHLGLEGEHGISIETGPGQMRRGESADGKPWEVQMPVAYGRIKGTVGADGDHLDVFIGPNPQSPHVFLLDQRHAGTENFDEHKILLGFTDPANAVKAYHDSYSDDAMPRIGAVTALGPDAFKHWLKNGDHGTRFSGAKLGPATGGGAGPSGIGTPAGAGGVQTTLSPLGDSEKVAPESPHNTSENSARQPTYESSKIGDEPAGRGGPDEVHAQSASGNGGIAKPQGESERHAGAKEEAQGHGQHLPDTGAAGHQEEVTAAHHQAIEDALGPMADKVLPVDIARAAEKIAADPQMSPAIAFHHAVIENAVNQGFITKAEAEKAYGPEVKTILGTGGEGASGGGAHAEQGSAKSGKERAGGAEETGVVPRSGEAGGPAEGERSEAGHRKDNLDPDAGRADRDTGREAAGSAKPETADGEGSAASVSDDQWWMKDLSVFGRERVVKAAGLPKSVAKTTWHNIDPRNQKALSTIRGTNKDPIADRDAPMWAEILAALPMHKDGRTREHELAFDYMRDEFAQSSFKHLTPEQKHQLLDHFKRPAGQRGQEWVLKEGRRTGDEHLIAYAADGHGVTRTRGTATFAKFTPEFIKELLNPANDIVAHHNHPEGRSLSHTDLMTLAYPGLRAVWAYGHNGNVYRGELMPEFKALSNPLTLSRRIETLYNHAKWRLYTPIDQAHKAKLVSNDEANGAIIHLVAEILAEAGIIDYRSNYQLGDFVSKVEGLSVTIENAIADARKEAFGEQTDRNRTDRRTGPLQHAGDVGASFERTGEAAGVGDQGRRTPDSQENDFHEGGLTAEEATNGVPSPVSGRDAGSEPENVPSAEEGGRSGEVRPTEGERGAPDVSGTDQGRAEGAGRPADDAGAAGSGGGGPGDDVRVPGRHDDELAGREESPVQRDTRAERAVKGENFHIEPGGLREDRSPRTKAIDNVKAITIANHVLSEDRPATAAEQFLLSHYVGWGGIKGVFPDADGEYGKGFEKVGADLKAILTPEEYDTARRSIQYAHYTSEDIINSMWKLAQQLGFEGGSVFEPGMGVGNFAGLMPPDIAERSSYQGVELDHVSARIAKLLYPKWGVRRDDFTRMPLPENTFDLAIGNPPFADITINSDPKYKQGFLLHDYFFAKSLDAVRPGGLLMFVTSAGTMNKIDQFPRQYLAGRAELVGSIRLPGNAFKKNAGTEVTTDIVILRKLMPGEQSEHAWTQTVPITLPGPDGQPMTGQISKYFADHPEMVLGKQDFADKLYEGRYSVKAWDNFDLKDALAVAATKLPRNVMKASETPTERAEADFDHVEKKPGTYYVDKDGSLRQLQNGAGVLVAKRGKGVEGGKSAEQIERIRGLVPIRDALRETYAADLSDDKAAGDKARAKLNAAYDGFVNRFGPINKAEIQLRRPSVVQQEGARQEAREEARYAGLPFDEGSFDPTKLFDANKSLAEIARQRKEAREKAVAEGGKWSEGSFDPEDMKDNILDKRPNIEPFMDDQEAYRLRAIEHYDDTTGKAAKGLVFSQNVITRDRPANIKSVNDAALHVLNQIGRLDLDAVGALVKKSKQEAIEALGERIYRIPGTRDTWETKESYLSGNVRKKLAKAKKEAERDPSLRRNVDALEAAQPAPLAPAQIHANLGMPWIPEKVVEDFATKELGLSAFRTKYIKVLAQWTVAGDETSVASVSTWGTSRRTALQLISDALNHVTPKIYDEDVDGKRIINVKDTQAAQDKLASIKEKFKDWIFADEARADPLAAHYNENYNNLVVREYDGSYLTTPGIASGWKWRPHQTRVISRIIQDGNTYMAHAVGAGKTSAMIGAGMEMRRLGLVKKPMYAVPNHMLAQFTKEFYEQYPTARIAVADDRNFHADRRKQFMANVALDDLDAIVITHTNFGMIPVSDEFSDSMVKEEMDRYRDALSEMPKGTDTRITRSRIEKQLERLEQRLSGKAVRKRDQVFTFDELGADFLFVDEAQEFRKLDFTTQMSNLKGITPEGSGKAWDLYVKTKLLEKRNPGRNLVLASGTPVTNTMAELYTVSRYLQPAELSERGLSAFDAWAGAFGEETSELEQDAAGGYKPVSRFAKFVNVAELSSMVRQIMDVVTSRQLEQYVTRPKIAGGKRKMHLAEKSPALSDYQDNLAARMKAMQGRGKPKPGDDIMLTVIGDGRHAAIDMRLVGGESDPDFPSKLELLIDNLHQNIKETAKTKFYRPRDGGYDMAAPVDVGPATQMVFSNLGISAKRGLPVHDYIRAELVRRGVPRDKIALISEYKTHIAKQKLFNDMNSGKILVMIGSTQKMGTGVNAQRRLKAIHNLDPLWYPSDDEQRNGRGLRQGNWNPELEINDYSTKGTYDSSMWGLMEKKARFIQGFFEGDPSMRDMEDLGEASQYAQAKAMTTNDPRLMRLTELKMDLERAQRRASAFESERYALKRRQAQARSDVDYYSARAASIKQDIRQREDLSGDKFKGTIDKTEYDTRVAFGEAILDKLERVATPENGGRHIVIGEISGFPLRIDITKQNNLTKEIGADIVLKRNNADTVVHGTSAVGIARSIEGILAGLDGHLEEAQANVARAEKFLKDSEGKEAERFKGEPEIRALSDQVKALESQLATPTVPAPAPEVEQPVRSGPKPHYPTLLAAAEYDVYITNFRATNDPSNTLHRRRAVEAAERLAQLKDEIARSKDHSVTLGGLGQPDKVIATFKEFWTSSFQPELMSDRALLADPLFARYKSAQAQEKDALIRASESEWNYWNKRGNTPQAHLAEIIRFLDDVETAVFGAVPPDPVQAAMARRYRRMLDANWALEKAYGSMASFVEDYFPHIWKKPDAWRAFSAARSAQMGPTWFQKKRTYEYIVEGLAAGLELQYTNPVDIIVHRLSSGVDMRQRMELLYQLKNQGLAWEGVQGGPQLVRRGWAAINAPDRKQWVIHPDAQLLWKNGAEAKGLWQAEHLGGSMFRGWMALKNAWIPVKLALSAFHPLHVLHINYSNGMALGWDQLTKGHDVIGALKSVVGGFTGPLVAAPGATTGALIGALMGSTAGMPVWGGIAGSIAGAATFGALKRAGIARDLPHLGKQARAAWSTRPSNQTPDQKAMVEMMNDGGFVPQLSQEMKIAAKRKLAVAFQEALRDPTNPNPWLRAAWHSMRRSIEVLQAPIFEQWIPSLKAAAYLQQAAALLKRRPELLTYHNERRVALRAIAKSIDNRFGEMFYGSLFWNRYAKDAAIGSFLSIGWNLGFVREFGGAMFEMISRPAGALMPPKILDLRPNKPRSEIRDATNKIAFALAYMASSALILGLMSTLMDDEHRTPEGLDWIFPRIGGVNPDGTPRRITNMSYIREVPMLAKHIQERGGNILTGTAEMVYNKMLFEPFNELINNRDYYGYNIWDENAPVYKQVWQAVRHTLTNETNPMALSGAKHAAQLSGHEFPSAREAIEHPDKLLAALKAKGVDMSLLGFGPAPAYVEKSAIQNRITYLYQRHVASVSRPQADEENSQEKMAIRSAILIAKRDRDPDMLAMARERGRAIGLSPKYMADLGKTPTDVYLFSRLPADDQKSILQQSSPEETSRYMPHASSKVRIELHRQRYAPASVSDAHT